MKRMLIVVDMQNDFITGSLGSPEAQAIVERVAEKIRTFDGDVAATKDTHDTSYPNTQEGRMLPVPHCVVGTQGWEFPPAISRALAEKSYMPFWKDRFASVALSKHVEAGEYEEVHLCGICTDICVVSNALLLKASLPETPVYVDASCCAGVTPKSHEAAIATMASCQIDILN